MIPDSDGYIKLWRRFGNSPIWTSVPPAWTHIAIGILLKANWKTAKWWDGRREVEIPAGSFVTSASKMCAFCRCSRHQYRRCISYLSDVHFLASERTNRYELITVLNWDTYQSESGSGGQVRGQERASRGPAEGQPRATIEEGKKGRREEVETSYRPGDVMETPETDDEVLSEELHRLCGRSDPQIVDRIKQAARGILPGATSQEVAAILHCATPRSFRPESPGFYLTAIPGLSAPIVELLHAFRSRPGTAATVMANSEYDRWAREAAAAWTALAERGN